MKNDIQQNTPLLNIKKLNIVYPSRHEKFYAAKEISFELKAGEILGIVGESGAGKSTVGNAVADLLTPPGYIESGDVLLDGVNIRSLSSRHMRHVRGKDIGFIFQDPMTSLNPLYTIGEQLLESILAHLKLSNAQAKEKAIGLLDAVGISEPEIRLNQYPHQFSGGMRQRVVIAIALSTDPKLIIADEPTTALDVSIQDQILQLIKKLCKDKNVGCILVTHDMGVVASVTDRVIVMYRGELMEQGATEQVLLAPNHDYTKSLISAVPQSIKKLDRFPLVSYIEDAKEYQPLDLKNHWLGRSQDEPDYEGNILSVKDISLRFETTHSIFPSKRRYIQAIDHVSFEVKKGETFGLVGESGSGKSTIARALTSLYLPDTGEIIFEGRELTSLTSEWQRLPFRRQMQMVFQNPYSSLNPRMHVNNIIAEPIRFHQLASSEQEIQQIVRDLIEHVGLASNAGDKFPHEFSGGQRQRISIARALATRPRLLICDEPTSALDVSVQAQILNLLKDLQQELGLSMLFISHDLPVIRQMCDRIAVMQHGKLVECQETDALFENANEEYTRHLINLMPRFENLQHTL